MLPQRKENQYEIDFSKKVHLNPNVESYVSKKTLSIILF